MKRKKEIENSVLHLTCMLNKLKNLADDSQDYNIAYNRLLIQRAELRKQLLDIKNSNLIEILTKKFNKLSSKKSEKLICDYF